MANDTIILSPEAVSWFKVEAPAIGSTIDTGAFVEYAAGGLQPATAGAAASMVAVENISTAQSIEYQYAETENVHAQALTRGTLVKVRAVAASYTAGQQVEIGAGGAVTAVTTGVPVGVVPHDRAATVSAGGFLVIRTI